MKKLFLLIFIVLLGSCETEGTNRNPFLPESNFQFELNMNLPLYNNLNTIGNPVYVGNNGVGIRGAFVMRVNSDSFIAWEASCPNQTPNDCSTLVFAGSQIVECPCDELQYSLFTGQLLNRPNDSNRYYDLLFYQAIQRGNSVIISN